MKKRKIEDKEDQNQEETELNRIEESDSSNGEEESEIIELPKPKKEKIKCIGCNEWMKKSNSFCGCCGRKNETVENDKMNLITKINQLETRKNEIEGKLMNNNSMNFKERNFFFPENFPEKSFFGKENGQMWLIVDIKSNSQVPVYSDFKILQTSAPFAMKFGYIPTQLTTSHLSILCSQSDQRLSKYNLQVDQMINMIENFGDNITIKNFSVLKHSDGVDYGIFSESIIFSDSKGRNGFSFCVLKDIWKLDNPNEFTELMENTIQLVEKDDN